MGDSNFGNLIPQTINLFKLSVNAKNTKQHPIEQTNNAYPSHGNLAAAILCQLFEELLWVFVRVSPNIECSFFQVYLLSNL